MEAAQQPLTPTPPAANLIKGRDVLGLKVITLQQGQNIEDVDELVYDPAAQRVTALVVDKGGFLKGAKVLLIQDIKSIGKDAVIVESEDAVKKASDVDDSITRIVKGKNYLTSDEVVTESGTKLGKISDIYFEPVTGQVVEFEVSQGVKNIQSGKKRVRVADIIRIGVDVIIVNGYVEEQMAVQAQEQGIQGAVNATKQEAPGLLNQAKDTLKNVAQQTQQKAQDLTQQAQTKLEETKNDPKNQERFSKLQDKAQQAKEAVTSKATEAKDAASGKVEEQKASKQEEQKKAAIGKYLTINILSMDDQMLAQRGDMITNQLLSQAESQGMLDQVINNTSPEPIEPPPETTSKANLESQSNPYEVTVTDNQDVQLYPELKTT